jgi:hypothetical protein
MSSHFIQHNNSENRRQGKEPNDGCKRKVCCKDTYSDPETPRGHGLHVGNHKSTVTLTFFRHSIRRPDDGYVNDGGR